MLRCDSRGDSPFHSLCWLFCSLPQILQIRMDWGKWTDVKLDQSHGYCKVKSRKSKSNNTADANMAYKPAYCISRGGRIKKTPQTRAGYPAKAWYKYPGDCTYECQAIEYLWWDTLSTLVWLTFTSPLCKMNQTQSEKVLNLPHTDPPVIQSPLLLVRATVQIFPGKKCRLCFNSPALFFFVS